MKIEWNKVTWYSKLLAAIFFVVVFIFGMILGVQIEEVYSMNAHTVTCTVMHMPHPRNDFHA